MCVISFGSCTAMRSCLHACMDHSRLFYIPLLTAHHCYSSTWLLIFELRGAVAGLLWSLSACEGTLPRFTAETLWDIVRVGRSSKDSWRKTASLSTLHNLLCYEGHDGVLAAGSLEFAVEVLCADHEPSVLSAAAKLLDQCCFDSRSKHTAVQGIPITSITRNLEKCLARDPTASDPSVSVIVEDNLSLLWNASDDVFFTEPTAWLRLTERFCQPPLLAVLAHCLASTHASIQQAAAATIHNFACNRALHEKLKSSGVMSAMPRLLDSQTDSTICCILATVELYGSDEAHSDTMVTEKPMVTASLVEELRRRIVAAGAHDKESPTARLQELVGTRKLLSAIDSMAAADRHKGLIVKNGTVSILSMVLRTGRADERGLTHALSTLLHLTFSEDSRHFVANPDVMTVVKSYVDHEDKRVRNMARALVYVFTTQETLILRQRQQTMQARGPGAPLQLQLSYHEADKDIVLTLRSSLLAVGLAVQAHDDQVDTGDFTPAVRGLAESTTVLLVCMSSLYKISARARLMATHAVRTGVRVVPILLVEASDITTGWLGALRLRSTSDQVRCGVCHAWFWFFFVRAFACAYMCMHVVGVDTCMYVWIDCGNCSCAVACMSELVCIQIHICTDIRTCLHTHTSTYTQDRSAHTKARHRHQNKPYIHSYIHRSRRTYPCTKPQRLRFRHS
jgi:hypothetical protein